jgi:hypothetical protein
MVAFANIGADRGRRGRQHVAEVMSASRITRSSVAVGLALVLLMVAPATTWACDLCAVYTAVVVHDDRPGFEVGVAEQYTDFDTRQEDSAEVSNPGEYLRSSITQVLLGYNLNRWVGFQLGLPIIARNYRRLEGGVLERGDETGFGDMPLLATVRPFTHVTTTTVVRVSLFGGLELPTGSTDRLREEAEEAGAGAGAQRGRAATSSGHSTGHTGDGPAASAIHGHDLALGSGSVDGVIGAGAFVSWRRLFLSAHSQYALRAEGSFDYRYANDLTWSGGPGAFLVLDDRYSVGLQAVVGGETKGKDEHDDEPVGDTGLTTISIGPRLLATWGSSLYADVAGELPVVQHNTGLQIVPDFRLRGGFTWRF